MGTVIKVSGLDLVDNKDAFIVPPVLENLEYFGILNTNSSRAVKNYARNKLNSAIIGVLDYQLNYVGCAGYTKKINTQVSETADFTIFLVCKSPVVTPTGRPVFLSNMYSMPADRSSSASTYGINFSSVRETGANHFCVNICRGTSVDNDTQVTLGFSSTEVDIHSWNLYMCRVSGLTQTLKSFTSNISKDLVSTVPRYLASNKLSIGGGGSSNNPNDGEAHIALAAIYSSALSDTQATDTYKFIKKIMLNKGIVV